MTTYGYDPSGLRSITDTKGSVNYFEYDFFQQLQVGQCRKTMIYVTRFFYFVLVPGPNILTL